MGEWLRVNHTLNQRVGVGDRQGGGKSLCGNVPRGGLSDFPGTEIYS